MTEERSAPALLSAVFQADAAIEGELSAFSQPMLGMFSGGAGRITIGRSGAPASCACTPPTDLEDAS